MYINDYAALLTSEDSTAVRGIFENLKQENGIEAVVLTIGSIRDYGTSDVTIESFATNLFNTWGIGDSLKNNGVLVLFSKNDREMRIEVGSGYGDTLNGAMLEIIDGTMVPAFKDGHYSRGIHLGAMAVAAKVTGRQPEAELPGTIQTPEAESNQSTGISTEGKTAGGIAGGLFSLTGLVFGLRLYLRNRARRCPGCRVKMSRLKEDADDACLDKEQRLEETIKSVDYDVWQCPVCGMRKIAAYKAVFSKYRKCAQCNRRTMSIKHKTIVSPTYSSTGKGMETRNCRNCGYTAERTYTIPRKERSSSSGGSSSSSGGGSSSSFGGGRSSGGGASGRW